jgi:hypothetical protein
MTTREREVAAHGCLECSIDHHHACSAAHAQELRHRGWSQPIDPGQQAQRSG